jgi:hypothetical protein
MASSSSRAFLAASSARSSLSCSYSLAICSWDFCGVVGFDCYSILVSEVDVAWGFFEKILSKIPNLNKNTIVQFDKDSKLIKYLLSLGTLSKEN